MHSVSHLRAIVFALGSFTAWVFVDTCAKLSGGAGIPPYEILAAIGTVMTCLLLIRGAMRGEMHKLMPKSIRLQTVRALAGSGSTMVNALAVKHLPLTSFYIVIFTAPMVIALFAAVFMHERLSWQKVAAIIAGFIGVVYAIDPFSRNFAGDWIGYAAVGTGVLFFAANFLMVRHLTQGETLESLAFGSGVMAMAIGTFLTLAFHREIPPGWIIAVLVGAGFLNLAGNLLNYLALKYTIAANVAQFHYTQIITGALMGYLIWHDIPSLHLAIGAAVIIASGCYIAAHAHRTGKSAV
jgi:drug/metabolite transporter (DMT)-like permease